MMTNIVHNMNGCDFECDSPAPMWLLYFDVRRCKVQGYRRTPLAKTIHMRGAFGYILILHTARVCVRLYTFRPLDAPCAPLRVCEVCLRSVHGIAAVSNSINTKHTFKCVCQRGCQHIIVYVETCCGSKTQTSRVCAVVWDALVTRIMNTRLHWRTMMPLRHYVLACFCHDAERAKRTMYCVRASMFKYHN